MRKCLGKGLGDNFLQRGNGSHHRDWLPPFGCESQYQKASYKQQWFSPSTKASSMIQCGLTFGHHSLPSCRQDFTEYYDLRKGAPLHCGTTPLYPETAPWVSVTRSSSPLSIPASDWLVLPLALDRGCSLCHGSKAHSTCGVCGWCGLWLCSARCKRLHRFVCARRDSDVALPVALSLIHI